MTDNTRSRGVLARIRAKLAETDTEPAPVSETPAESDPPPAVEHMFGSQYHVRQSFEQTMRQRGYAGRALAMRRRIVPSADADRQRAAATRRAGYRPGSVVWPDE